MSQEVVGTAVVVIRAATKDVKKQIRDGIKAGFRGTQTDAREAGVKSGVAWGRGFKAGIKTAGIQTSLKDILDNTAAAGAAGALAGAAYAAAFKSATSGINPGVPSPDVPKVKSDVPKVKSDKTTKATATPKNTKSVHEVLVRVKDAGLKTLMGTLKAVKTTLMGMGILSAAAFAGLAGHAAVGGLIGILGFLSQISGALLALPALANAALAPIAAMKIGFSGIGAAFSAMGKSGGAAVDTSKQVAGAQKAVAAAQKGVERAVQNVAVAEKAASRAAEEHTRAREDLSKAIDEAREDLEDLQLTLRGAALDEESAVIGVQRARERLADMPSDSTALDWQEANLALKEAELNLDSVREKNGDLAKEADEANAKGIMGSDRVVEAKRAVADAAEAEAEAQKGVQDALDGVADAQEALAEAMSAVGEAASGAGGAVDQFAEAMAKLSPNAREFVYAIQALGPAWTDLKLSVQDALFQNMGATITTLANVQLPVLKEGLTEVAASLNGIATELAAAFSTPAAAEGLRVMLQETKAMLDEMRPGVGALAGAWMNLSLAGAPFLEALGRVFSENMADFQLWTSDTEKMSGFIQRGTDAWLAFWEMSKAVGGVIQSIFGGEGAAAGGRMVERITQIATEFNKFLKSAEGIQALGNYWGGVERAISALAGPMSALVIGFGKLVSVLSDFAVNAAPGLEVGLRGLGDGIESMRPGMNALGDAAGVIFAALGPLFQQLGPVLSDVLVSLAPLIQELALAFIAVLQALLPLIPPLVSVLAPVLTAIFTLIKENSGLFAALAVGIGGLALVLKFLGPLTTAFKVIKGIITGVRIAWALLSLAFAFSPIGVVIAGVVAAGVALWAFFTKTEVGRKLWGKIWEGIKTAFTAVWENVLKPAWEAMKVAWDWLVEGFKTAWETVLKPVWDALVVAFKWVAAVLITALITPAIIQWNILSAAFKFAWETLLKPMFEGMAVIALWLWNEVLKPAWAGMQLGWQLLADGFQFVYTTFIKPVFDFFAAAAQWLWNTILVPAFNGIRTGFNAVGSFFMWVYNTLIKPAFDFVGKAAQWLWNNILVPAFDGIKAAFSAVGDFFKWVHSTLIKPAFDAVGTTVSWVIDNVAKPAFDRLKSGLSSVGDFFGRTVDGIRTVWDKLKGFLATPINFLIDTVWNNGLLRAWDTVRGFLPGLPPATRLSPIKFADGGPVPFAQGAKRGKDSVHGLLMPNEHVLTEDDVQAMGGHQNVYAWRRSLHSGFNPRQAGGESLIPRFAKGGAADKEPDTGGRLAALPGEGNLRPVAVLARRLIFRIWEDSIKTIGGFRANDAYPEHPSGRALDVMVPNLDVGDEVNAWTHANNPVLPIEHTIWRQKWRPAGNPEGSSMEDRGDPTQNHMDHVHTWYKEKNVDPNVVPEGLVGHDGLTDGDRKSRIKEKIQEILDKALDPLREGMSGIIGTPPPHFLGIPPEGLDRTKTAAVDKSFEFVENITEGLKDAYNAARDVKNIVVNTVSGIGGKVAGPFLRDTGGWVPEGLSIVRNETGRPEAVLNWEQLQALKQTLSEAGVNANELTEVKRFLSTSGLSMGAEADVATMMAMPPTDFGGIWEETMNAASISFLSELSGMVGLGKSAEKLIKPIDVVDASGRRIVKGGTSGTGGDLGASVLSDSPTGAAGNAQQLSGGAVPIYGDPNAKVTSQKVTLETKMPDLSGNGEFTATGNSMDYVKVIKDIAEGMGLGRAGAKIGVATGLVESNIKILANNAVPESFNFPHDGVGGDHDSVGIFQQRQAGWGTLAQRMSADGSAKLFFDKLQTFNWRGMDPGAAAQKVQVSAFPLKYGQRMGEADSMLATLYDTGGVWKHGTLGLNLSGANEMVLKEQQWKTAEGALDTVVRAGRDSELYNGSGSYSQSVHNPNQMAETVIFQGMDERKTFEEWDRYQRQNMTPVMTGRYRGGN